MQGDDGYAVLSGLEGDADKVVEAAESNGAVADAARKAADAANGVAAAVDEMRGDVSRSLREIGGSLKSMGAAASPIADMQAALEADRASMAEALGVLREISAAMRAFESLGGTQHPDGTNGGAWAPEGVGALAEGITGPIVAAIKELSEKDKAEAETQRSAVTSTTRTTSEAANRVGKRIDGSFARLSDAFSASMRNLMDAEQRRHEESMRRIDAVQAASSGIDRAQALAGSAVQVENVLRDALRGGFDVRRLAPQLASAIGSAFPALAEGFEHAENLRALPQKAAQQAAARTRPGDDVLEAEQASGGDAYHGDGGDAEGAPTRDPEERDARDDGDEPASRSPEEQDSKDVENVREGVLSALRDHDADVERDEEMEAGREHDEAVSVIEEGTESIPQAVGESVAEESSEAAQQQQQGIPAGLDAATQPEQAVDFGGSFLDRAIGWASGTRIGRALGKTKFGEKALGMVGASAVGEVAGEAGASAVGKAAGAAGAEAAGSAVAKALGTAGEAIGGAVSKALGPIGLALTAYEGVQSAMDIAQGFANASISQTGRADAVQGASISAQLGAKRAAATMTSALTDDQAQSIQDTLVSSGMRYDDADFAEAFEFAKQMNQRYGVDVTQAARQYVDSVKRGTSSTEQLYKSMDLLADVSDRTGQSFESLQEGYESAIKDLTDTTGSSSLANAIANAVLKAGGTVEDVSAQANREKTISDNEFANPELQENLDNAASQITNPLTGEKFTSYSEMKSVYNSKKLSDDENARKSLGDKIGNIRNNAIRKTTESFKDVFISEQSDTQKYIGTYIGGRTLGDLMFGDVSDFNNENKDEKIEEIVSSLSELPETESYYQFTEQEVKSILREFFKNDGNASLNSDDTREFAEGLVDVLINENWVSENEDRKINLDNAREDALSTDSGPIDTSPESSMNLSNDTLLFSFGTVSSNERDVYDNFVKYGGYDEYTYGTVYENVQNPFKTLINNSFYNEGPIDFTNGVNDVEASLMADFLLKEGLISKDDYNSLSDEAKLEIANEIMGDFNYNNESFIDFVSGGSDAINGIVEEVVGEMRDRRESFDDGTAVEIQNISSMLNNGLSMDVTLNADGVGNLATAVANCHAKASSDAGTNG